MMTMMIMMMITMIETVFLRAVAASRIIQFQPRTCFPGKTSPEFELQLIGAAFRPQSAVTLTIQTPAGWLAGWLAAGGLLLS